MKMLFIICTLAIFILLGPLAYSRTYVIPHVLESQGRITNTSNTFDTTIFVTYYGGLIDNQTPSGASVDLYLFDQTTGEPLLSATNDYEICNPCTFDLGPGKNRKMTIKIEDLINDSGGFPQDKKLFNGFAFISTESLPKDVSFNYTVESSQKSKLKTTIIDRDLTSNFATCSGFKRITDSRFQAPAPDFRIGFNFDDFKLDSCNVFPPVQGPSDSPFVLFTPHIFPENPTTFPGYPPGTIVLQVDNKLASQKISTTPSNKCGKNNFDTIISLFNQSGVNEWVELQNTTAPDLSEVGQPISLDLFLFDELNGQPMKSTPGNEVCNPCKFTLGTGETRKQLIKVDDLVTQAGGFPRTPLLGCGALVIDGASDNVNIQSFVVNSKSGPLDTSVFGFTPEALCAP